MADFLTRGWLQRSSVTWTLDTFTFTYNAGANTARAGFGLLALRPLIPIALPQALGLARGYLDAAQTPWSLPQDTFTFSYNSGANTARAGFGSFARAHRRNVDVWSGKQGVAKLVVYAVGTPNDLQRVSKLNSYAVVLPAIGPSYPQRVSKAVAYATVVPPLGDRQLVSKSLAYAVTSTYGVLASKTTVGAVVVPSTGNYVTKVATYALLASRLGSDISKAVAYAVVRRPIPVLQQKRIPQAIDFASITWDQQSRLLQYEMIRADGLDQSGPDWQPPRTLTLRCWQVVPFTPSEGSARVSKVGASAVLASRSLSVSKAATYALIAPRSLWVPKAMCYSVLSTYLPGISLSKCVAEVVCVPVAAVFVVKALAYVVVY